MSITMDKESWERGVRDGFVSGIRGLCPDTADPYSYWAGWSEGEAARRTYAADIKALIDSGAGMEKAWRKMK